MAHEVLEAGHAASSLAVAEQRRAAERARKSGPERISIALRCLDGQCGRTEEHDMHCLGCNKGLHGAACLGASAGKILVGVFMCTECTLEETGVSQPSNAARAMAAGSMIEHIVAGSENFGKKMATTTRQIDKFLEFMGADGEDGLLSPMHCVASLCMFVRWMGHETQRSRSLHGALRAIGALCRRAGRENITTHDSVKFEAKLVDDAWGTASTPKLDAR